MNFKVGDYVLYDYPKQSHKEYGIIVQILNDKISFKTLYALTTESKQYIGRKTNLGTINNIEFFSLITDEKTIQMLKKLEVFQ